jgi:hypothetical protein
MAKPSDSSIVRAQIHPGIGIARIGDSVSGFFIGPETSNPPPEPPGYYRDATGALKRQAARFRVYGYNAAGEVVGELTAANADIVWTAHLANKKASWYRFLAALDIPDAVTMTEPLRNAKVKDRASLEIDPGPRSITGANASGAHFDTGKFKTTVVPLGELQTDDAGRLIVLGGRGASASPSGAPVYDPADPDSFNNADDWYDDISDGPVSAAVKIGGKAIPVTEAWVVVAPPNYAPDVIGWRTMHELLTDVYVQSGWRPMPETVSFAGDILPLLRRLSNLQWVNQGFATMFGKGCPMDFDSDVFVAKLAQTPKNGVDPWHELRQQILNAFRPTENTVNEPRLWPWLYGDAFGSFSETSPRNNLALPSVQSVLLERWVKGDFINDWKPGATKPRTLDQVPLAAQPAELDQAALHFCLADAFHPGCEITWPIRHASMFEAPFRIRRRPPGEAEPNYGPDLTQAIALRPGGPLYAQGPGDISRWMALPWQGDTAFCRSGYEAEYDPYLPTFWPARVPNQVLTEVNYQIVIDAKQKRETRIAAFNARDGWLRALKGPAPAQMMQMIAQFGAMGIVEARPGVKNDPDIPEVLFVECLPVHLAPRLKAAATLAAAPLAEAIAEPETRLEKAGWESEEQLAEFRGIRVRHR